jgi:hypothetical protein
MTAAELIADLDAALADAGQTVGLKNFGGTAINVAASVRPVRADQIVGRVTAEYSNVVVSPTGIASLLPLKKGDKCVINEREREIEHYGPISVQDTIVRIELLVAG